MACATSEYLPRPSASGNIPTLDAIFIDIPRGRVEYLYLASELSHVRVQLRFQIRTYIYICMWPYVKLYAHAWWYVLWEGLSVNHILKHNSHFK